MKIRYISAMLLVSLAISAAPVPVFASVTPDQIQPAVSAVQGKASLSAVRVVLGSTVTASASRSSGCTYAFYYRLSGSENWKCLKKYSQETTADIRAASVGKYEVLVKTRDSAGRIRKEYLLFESVDFSAGVSLKNARITLGQKQTITASVSEGAVCSYKFYFKNPTDTNWRLIKNDTNSDTVTLKPAKTGKYQIYVKAVNSAGNIRKAYAEFEVFKTFTASHTLSSDTVEPGKPLTVTPSSVGGTGKIQYAVYYTDKESYISGANKWTAALKYGQTGNAVITIPDIGEYVVVTKAKDEKGTVKKSEYTFFRVAKKLSAGGAFKDKISTVSYRKGTVFIADAEGGAGKYTYSLKIREKDTSNWKLIYDFRTDPQFSIDKTQIGDYTKTGKNNFELTVTVRDQDGKTAEAVYPFTVNYSDRYELPVV